MNNKTFFFNVMVALIANICSGMQSLCEHPDNKIIGQLPVGGTYLCKNKILMLDRRDDILPWIEDLKTKEKVILEEFGVRFGYGIHSSREKIVSFNRAGKIIFYDIITNKKTIIESGLKNISSISFSGAENVVVLIHRIKGRFFRIYNYKKNLWSLKGKNKNLDDVFTCAKRPIIAYHYNMRSKLSVYEYQQKNEQFEIKQLVDKDWLDYSVSSCITEEGFILARKNNCYFVIDLVAHELIFNLNKESDKEIFSCRLCYPIGSILVIISQLKDSKDKTFIRYWDLLNKKAIGEMILKGSFEPYIYFSANGKKIIIPYRSRNTMGTPNFDRFHDAIMCYVPLNVRYEFLKDKLLLLLTFIKHYNDTERSVPKDIITLLIWWCYKKIR